jgi:hypothetical protein
VGLRLQIEDSGTPLAISLHGVFKHMRFHNNFTRLGRGRQERFMTERQFQLLSEPLSADRMTKGIVTYSKPEELPPGDSDWSERFFADAAAAAAKFSNR